MNGHKSKTLRRMVYNAIMQLAKAHDPRARIPFKRLYRDAKKAYKRGEIKI